MVSIMSNYNLRTWFRSIFNTDFDLDDDGDDDVVVERDDDTDVITIRASTTEDEAVVFKFLKELRLVDDDLRLASIDQSENGGTLSQVNKRKVKFDPNGDFEYLTVGESTVAVFTGKAGERDDGKFEDLVDVRFEIEVSGLNDAPTLTAGSGNATENGSPINVDLALLGDDIDSDDDGTTLTYSIVGSPSEGSATISGTTLTFNPGSDFQDLALGQTRNVVVQLQATDSHGAVSAIEDVTITVTGTNDVPLITSDAAAAVGSVTESGNEDDGTVVAGTSSIGGTLTASDVDNGAVLGWTIQGSATGTYGSITIDETTGEWTYTLDNSSASTQGLKEGDVKTETFTARVTDEFGAYAEQTITMTVNGTNDVPVITSVASDAEGSVTESGNEDDGTVVAGTPSIGGTLTASDVDTGTNLGWTIQGSATGTYGSIAIDETTGEWTYTLDNSSASTQGLKEGQQITETFTVSVTDEFGAYDEQTITLTVNGTNDVPTLTVGSGAATEDGSAVDIDLSILGGDVDNDNEGINLTYAIVGDPLEGTASIDGTTLTFDPGNDFQDLALGEERDVVVQVQATDVHGATSTVEDVTVTITGTNDAPIATFTTAQAVNVDGTEITGQLTSTDVDNAATATYALVGDTIAGLVLNTDGSWSFDPSNAAYESLPQDETLPITVNYSVTDEFGATDTEAFTINITGVANTLAGFVINGIDSGDYSGRSVSSAGDINNDGIDDILIGAYFADPNGQRVAGETYVVFGKDVGFDPVLNLSELNGSNGFVINGIDSGDSSGTSVSSAGDINNDGIDDILIGAYGADPNGQSRAGETYVVFGKDGGFDSVLNLSDLNGSNGFVINGIDSEDFSGSSVSSAGDINNDGIDDILIGAYGADPNGQSIAGETYVVFGKDGGFDPVLNLSELNGSNGFVINGIDSFDYSGLSVSSAGDINNDGIDDILIGAYLADPNGQSIAGETYVIFGQDDPFEASIDLAELTAI